MKNLLNINNALGILTLSSIIIASCGTPKLALPGTDWTGDREVFDVKGRQGILINQRLSFGQYTTQRVDRSWTKGSTWSIGVAKRTLEVPQATNIISLDHIRRKQTLRFAAESPSGEFADVYAASQVQAKELRVGEGNDLSSFTVDLSRLFSKSSNNLYYVQIYLDGSRQPWQMVLDNEVSQWKPGKYVGYLYGPNNRYYQLKPLRQFENKNGKAVQIVMGHIGFEIMDEGGTGLAAVSTMDKGQVYFSKEVAPKERFLLENLCAALLLQEQI
jgi:hypothetical protein